jgi:hypothetical protein
VKLLVLLVLLSSPLCLIYTIRYCHRDELLVASQHRYHQNAGHYLGASDFPRMVAASTRNSDGFSAVFSWPNNSTDTSTTIPAASDLESRLVVHHTPRVVVPMSDPDLQRRISSHSADREMGRMPEFETHECQAQWAWQKQSIPTCNPIHEVDLTVFPLQHSIGGNHGRDNHGKNEALRLVANGYWRDVWIVQTTATTHKNGIILQTQHDAVSPHQNDDDTTTKFVLKTIRYQHPFIARNFDRHRRDAMAMERLTSSAYIVNIYAFCGNSGAFEYAGGGDISTALWPMVRKDGGGKTNERVRVTAGNLSSRERFHIGLQAAMGVAAMHNVDQEGRASIAHTDISPTQFVKVNNRYKLNDFNRVWGDKMIDVA